jgi:hypothetical protein
MNWSPQPRSSRAEPWDAESLAETWPHIEWRQPVKVTVPSKGDGWLCRVCVANEGFRAERLGDPPSYRTREAFDEHMRLDHPVPYDEPNEPWPGAWV